MPGPRQTDLDDQLSQRSCRTRGTRQLRKVQNGKKHLLKMEKRPIALCLFVAVLCVACGGGSTPYLPSTAYSCPLPLQYANGDSSGIPIAQQANSVDRSFNNCNLAQVRAITMTLCVDHSDVTELSGELKLADKTIHPFRIQDGAMIGSTCLANSAGNTSLREYNFVLPSNMTPSQANGPWKLSLTDNLTNNQTGFFVAWDLRIQGLR